MTQSGHERLRIAALQTDTPNPSMTSCLFGTKSCRHEPSRTRFDIDQYADCKRVVEEAMRRRDFIKAIVGSAAAWPLAARAPRYASAQTVTKVFSVGWLTAQRASSLTPFLDLFRSGLGELGYREGDNLKIEYRFGDDNLSRVAPLGLNSCANRLIFLLYRAPLFLAYTN